MVMEIKFNDDYPSPATACIRGKSIDWQSAIETNDVVSIFKLSSEEIVCALRSESARRHQVKQHRARTNSRLSRQHQRLTLIISADKF